MNWLSTGGDAHVTFAAYRARPTLTKPHTGVQSVYKVASSVLCDERALEEIY